MSSEVVSQRRRFHASAPVRLDFAGGWTDVAPFAVEERGVVVSAAIDLRAHARVTTGGDRFELHAEDLAETLAVESEDELRPDGTLALLKAGLRLSGVGPCSLHTWAGVPPGSGLGNSGALGVAIVAALDATKGRSRSPAEVAEEAWQLEAVEADLAGGRQDQYSAALGGFNRLTFTAGETMVVPLVLDPDFLSVLHDHTIVCYTGTSRVSSEMITRVMDGYRNDREEVVSALRAMVDVADRMAGALTDSDLGLVGHLLSENWRQQQRLDPGMRTETMHSLETAMAKAGAIGGKAAGAGAGGSMFFVVDDPGCAQRAARELGVTVLDWSWAAEGVRQEPST